MRRLIDIDGRWLEAALQQYIKLQTTNAIDAES